VGPLPVISTRANGIDVKAVSCAYFDDFLYGVLIRADSSISSVQELQGKKGAMPVGSGTHFFLMLLLQQNGFNYFFGEK